MAATLACCQAVWVREFLADLQQEQIGPTEILCDNKVKISMTKKSIFHSRTKHINTPYQFICDFVDGGIISLEICGTNKQTVDVLSKLLPRNKHDFFKRQTGVCDFEERGSVD